MVAITPKGAVYWDSISKDYFFRDMKQAVLVQGAQSTRGEKRSRSEVHSGSVKE